MYSLLRYSLTVFLWLTFVVSSAQAADVGNISGQLILDDSWERKIYLSLIENFNSEFTISNNLILTSSEIDTEGNFKIDFKNISKEWSLLRLHVVKKGVTSSSLTIGGINENFMFIVANRDSSIKLYNTDNLPIFSNMTIEGAEYMQTFQYVKKLVDYPNSLDYEDAIIEKEFILDAVNEKLKMVADTCTHPVVSLYALHQIDFQDDFVKDKTFYNNYMEKWKMQDDAYFNGFRRNFPETLSDESKTKKSTNNLFWLIALGVLLSSIISFFVIRQRKKNNLGLLSVKEREVFELLQQGMTNKEISAECNIELTTVKSHVSSIYSKLKIKSRKAAMDFKIK